MVNWEEAEGELEKTYPTALHPFTKPSRVNSPIDGDLRSSAIPRQVTSSSWTWMSPKNFIAPSIPIPSGFSSGSSSLISRCYLRSRWDKYLDNYRIFCLNSQLPLNWPGNSGNN